MPDTGFGFGRKQSSLDGFSDSPSSMSSIFTPPVPIGWHLKKSTSPEKVNTYRAFANSSPPTMPFQGELNNDTEPQDFYNRYSQLKSLEGYKNELIEDLLLRYGQLSEQYKKVTQEHETETEYKRREKLYQENIFRLQSLMDEDPFVLVLLDLSHQVFRANLVAQGEAGGKEAASLLQHAVREHIAALLPNNDYRVMIRAFADLKGLAEYCQMASITDSAHKVQAFTRGFTQSSALCDFIDVGHGTTDVDVIDKVSESLKLYQNDYHCRQIMLCCSNDDKYSELLHHVAGDPRALSRITLIEGAPYDSNIADLPFDTISFRYLLEAKIAVMSSSPLTRQFSNLDVGGIKEFTPGSTPSSAPRPPEVVSLSATPAPSASSSPHGLWASIAAKPAAPIVPPPATTPSSTSNAKAVSTDGIPRNRKGQRIDPDIKHEGRSEVDRVKKLKMCNTHFLRGFCPAKNCPHVHDCKPTQSEITTLRLVARMAPCMNGGDCDDAKCIYGHMCPAPLQSDGRVTKDGKDCIFQEDCRFEGSRHLRGEDRKAVKLIQVR